MRVRVCGVRVCVVCAGVFETLPGPVQCKMLLKATEQCFNTLEKAEMLLLAAAQEIPGVCPFSTE